MVSYLGYFIHRLSTVLSTTLQKAENFRIRLLMSNSENFRSCPQPLALRPFFIETLMKQQLNLFTIMRGRFLFLNVNGKRFRNPFIFAEKDQ